MAKVHLEASDASGRRTPLESLQEKVAAPTADIKAPIAPRTPRKINASRSSTPPPRATRSMTPPPLVRKHQLPSLYTLNVGPLHSKQMNSVDKEKVAAPTADIVALGAPRTPRQMDASRNFTPPPRGRLVVSLESPRSPRSPRMARQVSRSVTPPPRAARSSTPPPLMPKHQSPKPPLLQGLEMKSIDKIRRVLQQNPETVNEVFWDHDCEPPLVCAVRLNCSAEIIQLLMAHGANTDAKDARGRTADEIAPQWKPWEVQNPGTFEDGRLIMGGFMTAFPEAPATYGNSHEVWRGFAGMTR